MKMLLPNLLTTTAFALTAQAFLVPAEIADKAIAAKAVIDEKVHELKDDVVAWATSSKQTVKVDCPGCPYAINSMRGGRHEWTTGINNDLIMEFSTEGKGLSVNGAPVLDANLKHVIAPLKVKQAKKESEIKEDGDKEWKAFEGDLGMSYGLSVNKVAQAKDGELFMVELQVLGLDGQMVNPDTVDLSLIRKPEGEMFIHSVKTHPTAHTGKQCKTMICRVMSIIASKMRAARLSAANAAKKIKSGCMRKFGSATSSTPAGVRPPHRGPYVKGGPNKFAGKFPPHPHGQNGGPHHRHHGMHAVMHAIKRIFKHVVLPVMIGVAAGMAASAVGMLVGQVIVLLWIKYRRNGNGPTYKRVEQTEEGRISEDGLPKYEELEGTEVELVDEKKELL